MLSIIIPALNEEKNLPRLFESIKKQNFGGYEIIVADAGSEDRTLEICKENNCRILKGGLPAKGKNEGAKIANGDLLLFMDADTFLSQDFFKNSLKEFKDRNLGIASFKLIPYSGNKLSLFLLNYFYNYPIVILEKILPHAANGILVKKELFEKIGGFEEDIKLAEDHYMARQAAKLERFGIIKSAQVFISDRRFKTDGWLRTGIKYLLCELHMIFLGPVRSDIFKYEFNHYNKK